MLTDANFSILNLLIPTIFRQTTYKIFLLPLSLMEKLLLTKVTKAGPETLKQREPYGGISHKQKAVPRKIPEYNNRGSNCFD